MLCRLLLAAATLAMLLGLWIISCLPIDASLCAIAALVWCLRAGRDIVDIAASHKRFSKLRICADGGCELFAGNGQWQAATLNRGCVVLARVAWFRLRLPDGHCYRALLRGDARESKQWRRLQVIWRHLGTDARSC